MSLVDLGKRLLEAARKGQDDEVRSLMANGAPFTTDWVILLFSFQLSVKLILEKTPEIIQIIGGIISTK